MTCLAILSDIHGNLPALEAVLADLPDVDGIVVAGDLTGLLYQVETVRLLRSLSCLMIRGNTDSNLLRHHDGQTPADYHTHLQFALLRWSHRHIDGETLDFLRSLPKQRVIEIPGTAAIRVVHGSPREPAESLFPFREPAGLDRALAQTIEPVLVCGHTHRPWIVQREGRLALNPGAVCGPLNGYVGAQYALLCWQGNYWQAELRTVTYDLDLVRTAFRETGLLEEGGALARAVLCCIETGENIALDLLSYARRLATEAGLPNCKIIPDEIWGRAEASFDWEAVGGRDPQGFGNPD